MWRHDAGHSAATPTALPSKLHLQWSLELPPPDPAWDRTQDRLQFDASYEPIAAGGRLFVPSMVTDSVAAFDLRTGERLWQFFAAGPVRFAPAFDDGKLFVVSDDGHLYCLSASDGALRWKFRGGPSDRKLLGNDRVISMWPARGAPVVDEGVVYFAAGVWPFMGIFIHALDAKSGEVLWTNSGSGTNYLVQPHGSPAFAGVSPQGYLTLTNDTLIVPGGRGSPAAYGRATGNFLYCHVGELGKKSGGYVVIAADGWFANRALMCGVHEGTEVGVGDLAVVTDKYALQQSSRTITALARPPNDELVDVPDARGAMVKQRRITFDTLWRRELPREVRRVHLQAADTLIASDGASKIFAFKVPTENDPPPPKPTQKNAGEKEEKTVPPPRLAPQWSLSIVGEVWSMLVADGRLVVVNREGQIFCFGEGERGVALPKLPVHHPSNLDGWTILSPRGATWKYLDDGTSPKNWFAPDFHDSQWDMGRAELGYGDGDEATIVSFGKDAKKKHLTTYFRRTFDLDADVNFDRLQLLAKIDDGAVIYLNGREATRLSMPKGEVNSTTRAASTPDEAAFQRVQLDCEWLVAGRNQLAVEVHQDDADSSDLSFDLELVARPLATAIVVDDATDDTSDSPFVALNQLKVDRDGHCLLVGDVEAAQVKQWLERTRYEIVVLESDDEHARVLRDELQQLHLLGRRAAVLPGTPSSAQLPPYLFQTIVAEKFDVDGLPALLATLRPYGGTALLKSDDNQHAALQATIVAMTRSQPALSTLKVERVSGFTVVVRPGALPGSAPWTHQGGNPANTLMSDDTLVKAPLGLLWFGGPSHEGVLPRHGHGPTPQVVGGRLFIEGRDMLRAVDVYTGRLLWERDLPEVGLYYDNTAHHPGANAIGSNYVSLADGIYVAYGRECLRLDPATGKTVSTLTLPDDDRGERPFWGYLGIDGDLLIAGSSPMVPVTKSNGVETGAAFSRFAEGSARLVALDRHSGQVKWTRDAQFNFRHNAICAGGGKVFCIDRVTDAQEALLKRRGNLPKSPPTLFALDATTGEVAWQTSDDIFGTWLAYSAEHDLLVQATSKNRDRAADETGSGLAVYRADKGERLWLIDKGYGGPVLLLGDRILTQGNAFELLSGKEVQRIDPITGEAARWTFTRNYGCTTAIGCQNLLTFRSAAAGFFDLSGDSGTGNFGGFRSSCTSNLVPADGVLNAPDYTRTCTCNYQMQCSLALVPMPEAEMWTFQSDAWNGDRVRRLGVNFGAPGDRKADDGTLWLEYPSVGGRSPDVPMKVEGASAAERPTYFRQHASSLAGETLPWVAASGVRGARKITITLTTDKKAKPLPHRVRLVFARDPAAGDNTAKFSVGLQGKTVLENYSPPTTGSRVDVREFQAPIAGDLTITLDPADKGGTTVLGGIEILRE